MLCECGCGEKVKKGNRYIFNHHGKNKEQSDEHIRKVIESRKIVKIRYIVFCKCGCGIKAKPGREYIFGHQRIGRIHSKESKERMSKTKTGVSTKQPCWTEERKKKFSITKTGYKASDETKKKMSDVRIGEKNHNWQDGKSFEPYSIEFNDQLKRKIRKRDNNQCQNPNCWNTSKRLCIHHIDYNKSNCLEDNLITLCTSCNGRANKNKEYWIEFYRNIVLKLVA